MYVQNICCDALKMSVFLKKKCRLLCFQREEEFNSLPSKNKVANGRTPGQRQQFKKNKGILEISQQTLALAVLSGL